VARVLSFVGCEWAYREVGGGDDGEAKAAHGIAALERLAVLYESQGHRE
jgi:hypothetical protein